MPTFPLPSTHREVAALCTHRVVCDCVTVVIVNVTVRPTELLLVG